MKGLKNSLNRDSQDLYDYHDFKNQVNPHNQVNPGSDNMKQGNALKLPKGWEIKKLGEVCEIKPPKREAKEKLNDYDLVSFIPMEDLGIMEKNIIPFKEKPLSEVAGSYTYFANNDVLLAKITPCFENGKIGVARNLKNGIGFGSSEYIVFRNKGEVFEDYLFYFLSRETFREEGRKNMTGAVGHKRVTKEFIENTKIPLPPLPEQQRIVSILDECFAAIDKAKANAEQNLKNARELFEGYLQGVFSLNRDSLDNSLNRDSTDLNDDHDFNNQVNQHNQINPGSDKGDGWVEKRFDEVCVLQRGFDLPTNSRFEGDYPLVSSNGITDRINEWKVKAPGVVTGRSGTIGNVHFVEEDFWPLNTTLYIKEFYGNDERYIYYFLLQFNLGKYSSGSGVPTLNRNNVHSVKVWIPKSIEAQQAIVRQLDSLRAETQKLEAIYQKKLLDLEEMKKSVLQKAFRGEL